MVHPCTASAESPTVMFTTSKRPRPTMRYPPHKSEPCYSVRSSIVQDLRLLPIDSSLVYLAVSEYISLSLCVFSGQVGVSSHVNHKSMSSNKKLLSLVKLVKLFVSCIRMLPFKKFSGLRPQPRWGAQRPHTPTCKAPPFTAGYAPVSYSCPCSRHLN